MEDINKIKNPIKSKIAKKVSLRAGWQKHKINSRYFDGVPVKSNIIFDYFELQDRYNASVLNKDK
jgi:hypothetical protein